MLRLGLCCLFRKEPIRFRATTAKALSALSEPDRLAKVESLCLANLASLGEAFDACARLGIGAFRILSPLLPRATHPAVGYAVEDLPLGDRILERFAALRCQAQALGLRLSFHPDQFVVLSTPHETVLASSLAELEHHGMLAELLGAEAINLHGGGVYGDGESALRRFRRNVERLSPRVRSRLTVENDDRCYPPSLLLPLCADLGIPFVYDVHHHRCLPDALSVEAATEACVESWHGREAWFHLSTPRAGWGGDGDPRPHADYVKPADFPACWIGQEATVDVEAKAKELAVRRLDRWLRRRSGPTRRLVRAAPPVV